MTHRESYSEILLGFPEGPASYSSRFSRERTKSMTRWQVFGWCDELATAVRYPFTRMIGRPDRRLWKNVLLRDCSQYSNLVYRYEPGSVVLDSEIRRVIDLDRLNSFSSATFSINLGYSRISDARELLDFIIDTVETLAKDAYRAYQITFTDCDIDVQGGIVPRRERIVDLEIIGSRLWSSNHQSSPVDPKQPPTFEEIMQFRSIRFVHNVVTCELMLGTEYSLGSGLGNAMLGQEPTDTHPTKIGVSYSRFDFGLTLSFLIPDEAPERPLVKARFADCVFKGDCTSHRPWKSADTYLKFYNCLFEKRATFAAPAGHFDLRGCSFVNRNAQRVSSFQNHSHRGVSLENSTLGRNFGLRLDGQRIDTCRFLPFANDSWSQLRSFYTGQMRFIHYTFMAAFFVRHVSAALGWQAVNAAAPPKEALRKSREFLAEDVPWYSLQPERDPGLVAPLYTTEFTTLELALGVHLGWWTTAITIYLVLYNILRFYISFSVNRLHEEEIRTNYAPRWHSDGRRFPVCHGHGFLHLLHTRIMLPASVLALGLVAWDLWGWLGETVQMVIWLSSVQP